MTGVQTCALPILCQLPAPLTDFGEGRFAGVVQPCVALVSVRRKEAPVSAPTGEPWPVARPELDAAAQALLAKLARLPCVPAGLFGDRGLQSDLSLAPHLMACAQPTGRFTVALRVGADVLPFELQPPRWHADPVALGTRLRPAAEFARVSCLLRQTARYPVAALSDGVGFRNSVLAGFALPGWPAAALV